MHNKIGENYPELETYICKSIGSLNPRKFENLNS